MKPNIGCALLFLHHQPVCLRSVLFSLFSPLSGLPDGILQLVILRSQSLPACLDVSISPCLGHNLPVDTYFPGLDLLLRKRFGSNSLC